MKIIKSVAVLVATFLWTSTGLYAQHHPAHSNSEGIHNFKHFRAGVMMYHTYIGTETSEGMEMLIVPSLGLDVEYWFNEKWGIGSHNDLELINFEVEKGNSHSIERESPLLLTVDALWKPWKGLVLLVGPGVELEPAENLFVVRAGLEYELELRSHWDIAPTVFYDNRADAYDTFSVGIGIGRRF